MPKFLFWNVNNNAVIGNAVAALAHVHGVDVLMLAEAPMQAKSGLLLPDLNRQDTTLYHSFSKHKCPRLDIYISRRYTETLLEYSGNYVIFQLQQPFLQPPRSNDLLVVAAHLESKLSKPGQDEYTKRKYVDDFSQVIMRVEDSISLSYQNTLVIGDLNMNPFEPPMIAANGLHAVMTRKAAQGRTNTPGERIVNEQRYRMFYNPLWMHMGERDSKPAGSYYGTYYYDKSHMLTYFWNWFDQVLLRPDLLPRFQDKNLHIITGLSKDGMGTPTGSELLDVKGIPNVITYSDHLPLLMTLKD